MTQSEQKEVINVQMTKSSNSPAGMAIELKKEDGEKCHGNGIEGVGPIESKIFDANELRMHLMPIWQKLYDNEPECIPFRHPVDPKELNIPV